VKTKENPAMKLRVCRIMYLRPGGSELRTDMPAMLAR